MTDSIDLLTDADLVIFRCCAATERAYTDPSYKGEVPVEKMVPLSVVVDNVFMHLQDIANQANCPDNWGVARGSRNNFRNLIDPNYKGNRKGIWKPSRLNDVWKEVARKVPVKQIDYLEADDVLAIHVANGGIGASTDKDLFQVEGKWVRWKTDTQPTKILDVSKLGYLLYDTKKGISGTGERWLAAQALLGDGTDGFDHLSTRVTKVYKSGKKAGQSYQQRQGFTPKQVYNVLRDSLSPMYEARLLAIRDFPESMFKLNAHCAYMIREEPVKGLIKLYDGSTLQVPYTAPKTYDV